jgi:hypothetical protein
MDVERETPNDWHFLQTNPNVRVLVQGPMMIGLKPSNLVE